MPLQRFLIHPLFLALLLSLSARAQMTWSLASGNESWPADKRTAIVNAMTAAVNLYNANGYFPKTLWANYNASVPTAQASYSGWIDFGGSISTRVALHEISHTLGVGQYSSWDTNRSGNTWTGTFAKNRVKLFDGASATLSADAMHFWPYGLNYDTEDGTTNRVRHIKMVSAMRRDMGIVSDSDNDGIPNDWEMFHFGNLDQSASGDADGDGIGNLAEYNADTDPAFASFQWTGATSSDWTTTTNWSSSVTATSGTYFARLNVNNAANHPLVYDATRGTTILRPPDRGLVIGSGTGGGAMSVTGGSFSTVGAASPDVVGNSGNTASLTIDGGSFTSDELQFGVNGTGAGTLTVNSGSAAITTLAYRFGTGGSGTVQLNGGTLTTAGFVRSGTGTATLKLNGGTLRASASSNTFLEGLSNAFIQSGGFVIDTTTQSVTINQVLKNDPSSSGGGLTKSGTGTLILSGANTYSGTTQITAGILQAAHAAALGSTAAGVSVANTATLALSNQIATPSTESATISGVGAGSRGALQSASSTNTWNGPVFIAASGTRIGVQDGAALTVAGNITETTAATALIFRAGLNSGNDIILAGSGNSWSGTTSLFSSNASGGAVKLGVSNAIPTSTIIQIAGPGVAGRFDLNGFHQTAAGLTHSTSGSSAIGEGVVTNTAATASILTLNLPANTTREFIGSIRDGNGSIHLVKLGSGTQILSGPNSYSGNTTISAGRLTLTSAFIADSSAVAIANGAKLALNFSGSDTIATLTLGGTQVPVGTYNVSHPTYGSFFSGTGSLIVTSGPSSTPFESWMNSFQTLSAEQKLPTADPDADGVGNLLEFVLNGSPILADSHILPTASLSPTHATFTFTRREESASATSLAFESSTSLTPGSWVSYTISPTPAPEITLGPLANGARTVTIRVPIAPGNPTTRFGRLRVSAP